MFLQFKALAAKVPEHDKNSQRTDHPERELSPASRPTWYPSLLGQSRPLPPAASGGTPQLQCKVKQGKLAEQAGVQVDGELWKSA